MVEVGHHGRATEGLGEGVALLVGQAHVHHCGVGVVGLANEQLAATGAVMNDAYPAPVLGAELISDSNAGKR